MSLNLPDSEVCFVDSTIFYYSLVQMPGLSEQSSAFLDRIVAGGVIAGCTVQVLADVVHKVMMYEAGSTGCPQPVRAGSTPFGRLAFSEVSS